MSKHVDNSYLKDRIGVKKSPMRSLYDWEEKTVLGRTAKNWAQIILFYIVFYIVLGVLFAFCMWVAMQTIDPKVPKWKLDESIIGTVPGLGFRPMPELGKIGSTLIWYKATDAENYKYWVYNLAKFLEVYKNPGLTPGREENLYECNYDRLPRRRQVCDVNVTDWHPCTVENDFDYRKGSPCFFIKLNKIYGWVPEYYNSTNGLPHHMPAQLKDHIANVSVQKPHELNTVWVTCEGENPIDNENIGPVRFIPRQGFPGYFYPYENANGYLSPIVAVHLSKPKKNVIINIECKAWAKNIKHNRQNRLGIVHLELLID